jgi:IS1 family transposase
MAAPTLISMLSRRSLILSFAHWQKAMVCAQPRGLSRSIRIVSRLGCSAPLWRLVLAFVVGKRTQASANQLLQRVVQVSDEHIPFLESDQLAEYRSALLHAFSQWEKPPPQGRRAPLPQPRRVARPDLLYAQVVKQPEQGQVVAVSSKVVFGDQASVNQRLAASCVSASIKSSFVERENLTLRQHTRGLRRETIGFSKESGWLERQLWLVMAY